MRFDCFFKSGSGGHSFYPYQAWLAENAWPETLVIPTGFGKTAAVLAAWLWKIKQGDPATPRRLVYCLPMRTLVEQTENAAKVWIGAAKDIFGLEINLGVLMGGRSEVQPGLPRWMLYPECPAILIGTQDILMSAALMRGYGVSRYRWPVDFALLHNDALWVFDEVQLTGATLATSAQLEGFRRRFGEGRGCHTLWMSATLDPAWLKTVDFAPVSEHPPLDLSPKDHPQLAHLWTAKKCLQPLGLDPAKIGTKNGLKTYARAVATEARKRTKPGTNTIIFLNTVARAQAVYGEIDRLDAAQERLLIHSRFRAVDRAKLMERLSADVPPKGRIVVATQALEAGVDVTSATMITEIASWSSLVQRFGRCNRRGEHNDTGADVFWINLNDKDARPYQPSDFAEAREKLSKLSACGPAELADIPLSTPPRGAVIRKRDLFDLFDTEPDLSGFDVDVSVYVRDVDDTDVQLFWRPVDGKGDTPPRDAPAPRRDELCAAPISGAKKLVEEKLHTDRISGAKKLVEGARAWAWNTLLGEWCRVSKGDIFPGLVIWVDATSGGYDTCKGFDPESKVLVEPILKHDAHPVAPVDELTSDADTHTNSARVSLSEHSVRVRDQAAELVEAFTRLTSADEREMIVESALWHDLGKAHETFKVCCGIASQDAPLAKTPDYNWRSKDERKRKYFRHELASALAYLANRQWDAEASLAAYLIAAHHGKVRMRFRALPKEQEPEDGRLFARGVWDDDELPQTDLGGVIVPATKLNLELMQLGKGLCGPSWSQRTQRLLKERGPFRLAWLEALLRIADWRASAAEEEAGHDGL